MHATQISPVRHTLGGARISNIVYERMAFPGEWQDNMSCVAPEGAWSPGDLGRPPEPLDVGPRSRWRCPALFAGDRSCPRSAGNVTAV